MANSSPSAGELFNAKAATDDQLNAAVDAYLADPGTTAHAIADGFTLDLDAAVARHRWASEAVTNPESSAGLKRGAVRTAILLAWAEKDVTMTERGAGYLLARSHVRNEVRKKV